MDKEPIEIEINKEVHRQLEDTYGKIYLSKVDEDPTFVLCILGLLHQFRAFFVDLLADIERFAPSQRREEFVDAVLPLLLLVKRIVRVWEYDCIRDLHLQGPNQNIPPLPVDEEQNREDFKKLDLGGNKLLLLLPELYGYVKQSVPSNSSLPYRTVPSSDIHGTLQMIANNRKIRLEILRQHRRNEAMRDLVSEILSLSDSVEKGFEVFENSVDFYVRLTQFFIEAGEIVEQTLDTDSEDSSADNVNEEITDLDEQILEKHLHGHLHRLMGLEFRQLRMVALMEATESSIADHRINLIRQLIELGNLERSYRRRKQECVEKFQRKSEEKEQTVEEKEKQEWLKTSSLYRESLLRLLLQQNLDFYFGILKLMEFRYMLRERLTTGATFGTLNVHQITKSLQNRVKVQAELRKEIQVARDSFSKENATHVALLIQCFQQLQLQLHPEFTDALNWESFIEVMAHAITFCIAVIGLHRLKTERETNENHNNNGT